MSVLISTKTGDINIKLTYLDGTQCIHLENFLRHCALGSYNKNNILRYIPEFILQLGDPSNSGKQSEEADLKNKPRGIIEEQFKKSKDAEIKRGSVMCINNPKNENSLGSQFFIVLSGKYNGTLGDVKLYTKVGQIVEGLDAIEKVEADDDLNNKELVKKNGKVKGKWKKESWIDSIDIQYNPFAI